jgi:hypothetical protein
MSFNSDIITSWIKYLQCEARVRKKLQESKYNLSRWFQMCFWVFSITRQVLQSNNTDLISRRTYQEWVYKHHPRGKIDQWVQKSKWKFSWKELIRLFVYISALLIFSFDTNQRTVFETKFENQEITRALVYGKIFVIFLLSFSILACSVLLKDSLKITWHLESGILKKTKNIFGINEKKYIWNTLYKWKQKSW